MKRCHGLKYFSNGHSGFSKNCQGADRTAGLIFLFFTTEPRHKPASVKLCSKARWVWIYAAVFLELAGRASAHDAGLSSADLRFDTNHLDAVVTLSLIDLKIALSEIEIPRPLDANGDGKISGEEFTIGLEAIQTWGAGLLQVEFAGQAVAPAKPGLKLDGTNNCQILLSYSGKRPKRLSVTTRLFHYLPGRHQQFLTLTDEDGKDLGKRMLTPEAASCEFDLSSPPSADPPRFSSFRGFLWLGVEHIGTGYDHLLFLLALLLVCRDFKSAVQIITSFTLAHSMTLAAATFNVVQMSSDLVEPLIAASIVYVGLENLVRPGGPKGRWKLTFVFGLVHGFGFAGVLRDLGIGAGKTGVGVPLVSFNLGVELGQLAVASVLLPLIWRLCRRPAFVKRGVPLGSALVAVAGGYWFVQRVWFN